MQYEIKHIHENLNVTVVYVTHDQSEAMTMSNRVAVFEDGVIQQLSTPDVLYEEPQNAFVAQFIGENNKISGEVMELADEKCIVKVDSGEIVKALKVNINKTGDRTTLSLRPERVTLNPAAESLENIFEGTVRELIYLGDHLRTRINVCGNNDFTYAEIPAINPPPPISTKMASMSPPCWRRISSATVPWPAITSGSSKGCT